MSKPINEQELLNTLFKNLYGVAKQFISLNAPEIGKPKAYIMARIATEKLAELFASTPNFLSEEAEGEVK